jgi:hypothetical protein
MIKLTKSAAALAFATPLVMALGAAPADAALRMLPIPLIPCGDTAALEQQISIFNQESAPTQIYLSKNCVYAVTAANHRGEKVGADGLPDITGNITIMGQGSTITRSADERFRLFHVAAGGSLTLNGLTVSSGTAIGGPGGGILDQGNLTLIDTTVTGNTAAVGGGVFVDHGATAQITGGSITANHGTDLGGGIANIGNLVVTGTDIIANASISQGGGIDNNSGGTLTLNNVTVSHNLAGSGGGAIADFGAGTVRITGGKVVENTSQLGAGGIYDASGAVTIATSADVRDNTPTDCLGSPVFIANCLH